VNKVGVVRQILVEHYHALKIRAKSKLVDRHGKNREMGDTWLMRKSVRLPLELNH